MNEILIISPAQINRVLHGVYLGILILGSKL